MVPAASVDSLRTQIVTSLASWSDDLGVPPARRGRPPILTDTHLWGCTLLAVLDGCPTQRGIWGEVTTGERWGAPVDVVDETVRKRLLSRESAPMAVFFAQLTDLMTQTLAGETTSLQRGRPNGAVRPGSSRLFDRRERVSAALRRLCELRAGCYERFVLTAR